jgi:hypothetical protein
MQASIHNQICHSQMLIYQKRTRHQTLIQSLNRHYCIYVSLDEYIISESCCLPWLVQPVLQHQQKLTIIDAPNKDNDPKLCLVLGFMSVFAKSQHPYLCTICLRSTSKHGILQRSKMNCHCVATLNLGVIGQR